MFTPNPQFSFKNIDVKSKKIPKSNHDKQSRKLDTVWLDFSDIATLGTDRQNELFSDCEMVVNFSCSCPCSVGTAYKTECRNFVTKSPLLKNGIYSGIDENRFKSDNNNNNNNDNHHHHHKKEVSFTDTKTKIYNMWSGSLLRSRYFIGGLFYKYISPQMNDSQQTMQSTSTKQKRYCITLNEECISYDAFDIFINLINRLHTKRDIEDFNEELQQHIIYPTESYKYRKFCDLWLIISQLSSKYTFPLVEMACHIFGLNSSFRNKRDLLFIVKEFNPDFRFPKEEAEEKEKTSNRKTTSKNTFGSFGFFCIEHGDRGETNGVSERRATHTTVVQHVASSCPFCSIWTNDASSSDTLINLCNIPQYYGSYLILIQELLDDAYYTHLKRREIFILLQYPCIVFREWERSFKFCVLINSRMLENAKMEGIKTKTPPYYHQISRFVFKNPSTCSNTNHSIGYDAFIGIDAISSNKRREQTANNKNNDNTTTTTTSKQETEVDSLRFSIAFRTYKQPLHSSSTSSNPGLCYFLNRNSVATLHIKITIKTKTHGKFTISDLEIPVDTHLLRRSLMDDRTLILDKIAEVYFKGDDNIAHNNEKCIFNSIKIREGGDDDNDIYVEDSKLMEMDKDEDYSYSCSTSSSKEDKDNSLEETMSSIHINTIDHIDDVISLEIEPELKIVVL